MQPRRFLSPRKAEGQLLAETIEGVADYLLREILLFDEPPSPAATASRNPPPSEDEQRTAILTEVKQLSEDEVARQIDEELQKLLG